MKAAHADPQLRAAQASHMAQVESSFASALAERLGTDPDRDPYPLLLASAATAVLRATMSFWARRRRRAARAAGRRAPSRRSPTGSPRTARCASVTADPAAEPGNCLRINRKDDHR